MKIWRKKTFKEPDYQHQSLESKVRGLLSNNAALQEELHKQQSNNHKLEAGSKLLKDESDSLADLQKSKG